MQLVCRYAASVPSLYGCSIDSIWALNYMWTAFGPTNVAIHQVNTAMEFGDVQIVLDIGPALDTSGLPTERRVRHALDVAPA